MSLSCALVIHSKASVDVVLDVCRRISTRRRNREDGFSYPTKQQGRIEWFVKFPVLILSLQAFAIDETDDLWQSI